MSRHNIMSLERCCAPNICSIKYLKAQKNAQNPPGRTKKVSFFNIIPYFFIKINSALGARPHKCSIFYFKPLNSHEFAKIFSQTYSFSSFPLGLLYSLQELRFERRFLVREKTRFLFAGQP